MYSKILNMTMINTNPNPEYDMAKNTLLIESTIPLDIADANKIIGQNSSKSDIKNNANTNNPTIDTGIRMTKIDRMPKINEAATALEIFSNVGLDSA